MLRTSPIILVLLVVASLLIPSLVLAGPVTNSGFGNTEVFPQPGKPVSTYATTEGFMQFVGIAVTYLIVAVIIVGTLMIVGGGYVYMTAGGDASRVQLAKTIIGSAVLGIILALLAWLILYTLSPQFVGTQLGFGGGLIMGLLTFDDTDTGLLETLSGLIVGSHSSAGNNADHAWTAPGVNNSFSHEYNGTDQFSQLDGVIALPPVEGGG